MPPRAVKTAHVNNSRQRLQDARVSEFAPHAFVVRSGLLAGIRRCSVGADTRDGAQRESGRSGRAKHASHLLPVLGFPQISCVGEGRLPAGAYRRRILINRNTFRSVSGQIGHSDSTAERLLSEIKLIKPRPAPNFCATRSNSSSMATSVRSRGHSGRFARPNHDKSTISL